MCYIFAISLSYEKEQNNTSCSNMNTTRDYHAKSERERQYGIPYMRNLNCDTNEPTYETETEPQRKDWWLPKVRGLGQGWSERLGLADVSFHVENG